MQPISHSQWLVVPTPRIEQLKDAVLGSGLEATQMSRGGFSGSLAFCEQDGIQLSSGLMGSKIEFTGILSRDRVSIGAGLQMATGCRQWGREITSGNIGVFHANDDHDAFYQPNSLYICATMSLDKLSEMAARQERVIDRTTLGGSGVSLDSLHQHTLTQLRNTMHNVHAGGTDSLNVLNLYMQAIIQHFSRSPIKILGRSKFPSNYQILARSREFIAENLSNPITIDDLASAARCSNRTLHRTFRQLLDITPYEYVQCQRLHRIRRELADEAERQYTISMLAAKWGLSEPGRFARQYCELFGELPSKTIMQKIAPQAITTNILRT